MKTDYRTDTIPNINYAYHRYRIQCNTCFLLDGDEEVVEARGFGYEHDKKISRETLFASKT